METNVPSTFFALYAAQGERREAALWTPHAEQQSPLPLQVMRDTFLLPETPGCRLTLHVTNLADTPLVAAVLYSRELAVSQRPHPTQFVCRWSESDEFVIVSAAIADSAEGYAVGVVREGAHVTFGQWETFHEGQELWTHFSHHGTLSPRFASDREVVIAPALAVAARFDLPPHSGKPVTFVWAWWMPGPARGVAAFANVQQVAYRLLQAD